MDLSKIDISIKHGRLFSKKVLVVLWCLLVYSIIFILSTTIITIIFGIYEGFFAIIIFDVTSFIVIAVSLSFIIWRNIIKKKFLLFLEDGIETKAKVTAEDVRLEPSGTNGDGVVG